MTLTLIPGSSDTTISIAYTLETTPLSTDDLLIDFPAGLLYSSDAFSLTVNDTVTTDVTYYMDSGSLIINDFGSLGSAGDELVIVISGLVFNPNYIYMTVEVISVQLISDSGDGVTFDVVEGAQVSFELDTPAAIYDDDFSSVSITIDESSTDQLY